MENFTSIIGKDALVKARSIEMTGGTISFYIRAWLWADNDNDDDVGEINKVKFNGTKISVTGNEYALVLADELAVDNKIIWGAELIDGFCLSTGNEIY